MSGTEVNRLIAVFTKGGITGVSTEDLGRVKDAIALELDRRAKELLFTSDAPGFIQLPLVAKATCMQYVSSTTDDFQSIRTSGDDIIIVSNEYGNAIGNTIVLNRNSCITLTPSNENVWKGLLNRGTCDIYHRS